MLPLLPPRRCSRDAALGYWQYSSVPETLLAGRVGIGGGGIIELAEASPETVCTVDLPQQHLSAGEVDEDFDFEAHAKHMLVNGLDQIGLTLEDADAIEAFEADRPAFMPVTA